MHQQSTGKLSINTEGATGNISMATASGVTALTIDSSQNATFNADVKISKASGSSTQSFVPANGQSSQIKFYQDDGSTQDARIFAPEGAEAAALIALVIKSIETGRFEKSRTVLLFFI